MSRIKHVPQWCQTLLDHTPVGVRSLLVSAHGIRKHRIECDDQFRRALLRTEVAERDELEQLQLQRLRQLVGYAEQHVPHYRDLFSRIGFSAGDLSNLEVFKEIPILTKSEVRQHPDSFVSDEYSAGVKRGFTLTTSGTTGTPMEFTFGARMHQIDAGLKWRWKRRHGYEAGEGWHAYLAGHPSVPAGRRKPPFWVADLPNRILFLSAHHLCSDNIPHYARILRDRSVGYLHGYPSSVYILARLLLQSDIAISLRAVFVGSEPMHDFQERTIARAFECPISERYSLTEQCASAASCELATGLHVDEETCIVELQGQAEADQHLRVIGTSLCNEAMPLIRYDTGDIARKGDAECTCGRTLRTMGKVETKSEDIVLTCDGRFISPSSLTHPLKDIRGLQGAQIVQEAVGQLVVRYVPGSHFEPSELEKIARGLHKLVGLSTTVRFEKVSAIEKTATGKTRFVLSHVATAAELFD